VIRAVVDTNVLVSGLLSPAGNEALILLATHSGAGASLFLGRDPRRIRGRARAVEISFSSDEIAAVLAMFRSQGELFLPEVSGATSSDPDDTKFLQCAQAAQADYIVTGNKRDFPAESYGVTHVVSAGELLDRITFEI
jgi:predicted nucleic acid-binding protein